VYCVDAYNGQMLWELRLQDSRRLGVFLDSGSMAVDADYLYIVKADQCLGFDVKTGEQKLSHSMPQLIHPTSREWGYLAYQDQLLFGSGRRKGASYTKMSRDADAALWYRDMKVVTSDYLFVKNRKTGRDIWTYKQGLILNPTITIGGEQVFFIETTSPEAMKNELGRMPIKTLFDGGEQNLVALNMHTGAVDYKKTIDTSNYLEPVFLNYSKGVLILNGSKLIDNKVTYHVDAFDSKSGRQVWEISHNSELAHDGGHGEYNRHPTIVKDTVFVWPYAYDLKTGRKRPDWKFNRRGHGCGGISASNFGLFWRGQNPYMYDLNPGKGAKQLTKVTRPGCWINIIPAGGMILIPEASSGCTCGHSIQTSMAFITTSHPQNL
jgi:outer membrane protein assembly factor BamB